MFLIVNLFCFLSEYENIYNCVLQLQLLQLCVCDFIITIVLEAESNFSVGDFDVHARLDSVGNEASSRLVHQFRVSP